MNRPKGTAIHAASLALSLGLTACDDTGDPRAQLVVWIDTDLPLVGQVAARPELSLDASVDTLRIDVLDGDNATKEVLVYVAPDALDWPVSFGVTAEQSPVARLRIRLFRGLYAELRDWGSGFAPEPPTMLAVDRMVEIPLPAEGIQPVRVTLTGECLGLAPRFVSPAQSCVDAARPHAPATEGVDMLEEDARPTSQIGTWPTAIETSCPTDGLPAGSVCVPGGYSLLGDAELAGFNDGILYAVDPYPLRPVVLSPFAMDRTEFTVGRFRELLAAQPDLLLPEEIAHLQVPGDGNWENCTYGGPSTEEQDDYPLNCITRVAAMKLCGALGGTLPTEAQWEHAARGRGQHRLYPWGDEWPACCSAVLERSPGDCDGIGGPAQVASTVDAGCDGPLDVSRDDIVDLAGNIREMTQDSLVAYDESCWAEPGVLHDPMCEDATVVAHIDRGAAWTAWREHTVASLRASGFGNAQVDRSGFRCVYPLLP